MPTCIRNLPLDLIILIIITTADLKNQNDKQKQFSIKKKENAKADGQNTNALKKRKMMKKSEEDTLCLYCRENDSTEGWVTCGDCHRWLYYSCAGLEEKDKRPCITSELCINMKFITLELRKASKSIKECFPENIEILSNDFVVVNHYKKKKNAYLPILNENIISYHPMPHTTKYQIFSEHKVSLQSLHYSSID